MTRLTNIKFGRLDAPDREYILSHSYRLRSDPGRVVNWSYNLAELDPSGNDPYLLGFYDQRASNACCGFAGARMMSWFNKKRYDASWLWDKAKEVDGVDFTNPGDNQGTTVVGTMRALKRFGGVAYKKGWRGEWRKMRPDKAEGILGVYEWATTVDQIRDYGKPVVIGTAWYSGMMEAVEIDGHQWIGRSGLGQYEGGHAYTVFEWSDDLDAAGIVNNWGRWWQRGLVHVKREFLQYLLDQSGDVALINDRPGGGVK